MEARGELENAIANGETFNYGERPRVDQYQTHDKLDGNPPRYFDTNKRNELKREWISPTDNWVYQLVRRLAEKGLRYKKRKIKIGRTVSNLFSQKHFFFKKGKQNN